MDKSNLESLCRPQKLLYLISLAFQCKPNGKRECMLLQFQVICIQDFVEFWLRDLPLLDVQKLSFKIGLTRWVGNLLNPMFKPLLFKFLDELVYLIDG